MITGSLTALEFQPEVPGKGKQSLAVGDESGALYLYEVPPNLSKPVSA